MDRASLEALVMGHQAELFRYARYLGADHPTAEDVVQETFLAVAVAPLPAFADPRRRAAWLRGVARNVFLMYCRRRRASPVTVDGAFLERAESTWAGRFLRGEDGFDYVEALGKCLDELPERQRSAVDLQYAQRKGRSEVARALNMTEDGVKSLLRRIRAVLAECVERHLSSADGAAEA